jgi:hypothetical protein
VALAATVQPVQVFPVVLPAAVEQFLHDAQVPVVVADVLVVHPVQLIGGVVVALPVQVGGIPHVLQVPVPPTAVAVQSLQVIPPVPLPVAVVLIPVHEVQVPVVPPVGIVQPVHVAPVVGPGVDDDGLVKYKYIKTIARIKNTATAIPRPITK